MWCPKAPGDIRHIHRCLGSQSCVTCNGASAYPFPLPSRIVASPQLGFWFASQ